MLMVLTERRQRYKQRRRMKMPKKGRVNKEEIMEVKEMELDDATHEVKGIEIFAEGEWNGDKYSTKDLDTMVENFNKQVIRSVPLKVGHDMKQKVAGQPAVGLLQRVYRVGKKLVADIANIPKTVAELINKKAFHSVSAEIAWNADFDGTIYDRLLTGVALLGAEIPAVNKLAEIPTIYKAEFSKIATFELKGGEIEMAEEKVEEQKAEEVKENKAEVVEEKVEDKTEDVVKELEKKLADEKAEREKITAELDKIRAEKEAELAKKEEEIKLAKEAEEKKGVEEFARKIIDEKKAVPSMMNRMVKSLLDADNTKKVEYALDDKTKVNETARENLMKIYEGLKELKIFTEMARSEEHTAGTPQEKTIALADKYVSEGVAKTYKEALVKVYEEHPEWEIKAKPIR